jgi:hypothetical protein
VGAPPPRRDGPPGCAAGAGCRPRWQTADPLGASGDDPADINPLRDYIHRVHPEQFREPWVSHPYGFTKVDGTPAPTKGVRVLAATVEKRVADLMHDRANGVYSSHQDELTVRPQMLVLTRQLYDRMAVIGFAPVEPDPVVPPGQLRSRRHPGRWLIKRAEPPRGYPRRSPPWPAGRRT